MHSVYFRLLEMRGREKQSRRIADCDNYTELWIACSPRYVMERISIWHAEIKDIRLYNLFIYLP
jgi:hypothetical protein